MRSRVLIALCAAMAAAVLIATTGVSRGDDLPVCPPICTDNPSPSPSASSSPTQNASPSPRPTSTDGGGGQTGTQPDPAPQAPPSTSTAPGAPGLGAPGAFPLQIPDIVRSPAQSTTKLLDILSPLADSGLPIDQAIVLASAPFPVAGQASFIDDWGFPRYFPVPHLHEGTDIFADFGTPIVASGPGTVAGVADTAVGGLAVWVSADDGMGLYYAHLLSFAPGLAVGQRVEAGTLLGTVGATGDAIGGAPHLHFEVHPPIKDAKGRITLGGVSTLPNGLGATRTPAVDPKPYLDGWLRQAEANAQALVDQLLKKLAVVARDLHFTRRFDDVVESAGSANSADAIWFSVFEPAAASLGLARDAVSKMNLRRGSFYERTLEDERLAAVRLAVHARELRLSTFTGMPLLGYQSPPGAGS